MFWAKGRTAILKHSDLTKEAEDANGVPTSPNRNFLLELVL